MGFNVHDLLRLRDPANLVSRDPLPKWANQALSHAPWVVVRRAPMEEELIPVGIRGRSRGERFGAYLHTLSIVECVSPEALSASQAWEKIGHRKELPAMRALFHVHAALQTAELSWGPIGSVGFELASGFPAAHGRSDLDLIVRVSDFNIRPAITRRLLMIVQEPGVRVEILLETTEGAISLLEYANGEPTLVLRTVNGPCLRGNVSASGRNVSASGRNVSAYRCVGLSASEEGRIVDSTATDADTPARRYVFPSRPHAHTPTRRYASPGRRHADTPIRRHVSAGRRYVSPDMSVAFLFPGQGSQQPGMLHDLPKCETTAATLEEASIALTRDVLELDSEVALRSTTATQLSLLIAGVAFARALLAKGAVPHIVGGLSVGSFAAAVVAEMLDLRLALILVRLRGELMEKMYPCGYGMAAIMGLNEKQLSDAIAEVDSPEEPVFLANLNAPRQMVVSGALAGLERLIKKAGPAGATRAQLLNVSVPSHCRLLEPVAAKLDRAMAEVVLHPPKYVFIGNRGGRPLRDSASVRLDLVSNVAHAVRWHDATTLMFELGARLFVELPPGRVLADLASVSFPEARAIACAESRLDFIAQIVRRNQSSG